MARGDRVTITTKTGQTLEVVATTVGSSIDLNVQRDWVTATAERSDKERSEIKKIQVASPEVVAITKDHVATSTGRRKGAK